MNFNRVILAGRLTRPPEVRYAQSGAAVCKVGLAVNRRVKKGDEWIEEATFVDVTIFGKRGEAFEKHHNKGDEAFIEGSLRLDTWDDKQTGQRRSKLYVIGDTWEFVGAKGERGQSEMGGTPAPSREPAGFLEANDAPF